MFSQLESRTPACADLMHGFQWPSRALHDFHLSPFFCEYSPLEPMQCLSAGQPYSNCPEISRLDCPEKLTVSEYEIVRVQHLWNFEYVCRLSLNEVSTTEWRASDSNSTQHSIIEIQHFFPDMKDWVQRGFHHRFFGPLKFRFTFQFETLCAEPIRSCAFFKVPSHFGKRWLSTDTI